MSSLSHITTRQCRRLRLSTWAAHVPPLLLVGVGIEEGQALGFHVACHCLSSSPTTRRSVLPSVLRPRCGRLGFAFDHHFSRLSLIVVESLSLALSGCLWLASIATKGFKTRRLETLRIAALGVRSRGAGSILLSLAFCEVRAGRPPRLRRHRVLQLIGARPVMLSCFFQYPFSSSIGVFQRLWRDCAVSYRPSCTEEIASDFG